MIPKDTSRHDLLAIVELLTALVTSGLETAAVMKEVAERAALLTGAPGAVVELAEGDEMVYRAVSGIASGTLGLRLKRASSLSGLCVEQEIPLNCEDASTDSRVDRDACERVGVASMICVPLLHGGHAVGVLKVLSREKHAFNDGHAQTLRLLASVIASSLSNAGRYETADFQRQHDALTELGNRRAYEEELVSECARARRYQRPLTLALLDLNGFKAVNDTHGHPAGDDVLRKTSAALRRIVRRQDKCFRLGGDEFAILFPETDRAGAGPVLERIQREVAALGDGISVSAGVAEMASSAKSRELHAAADEALYVEKDAFHGRNGRRQG